MSDNRTEEEKLEVYKTCIELFGKEIEKETKFYEARKKAKRMNAKKKKKGKKKHDRYV
jgi:hypothetical protein